MLMSFVVDDQTFNVDQKLPAEEKAPVSYPNTLPESFTKYGLGAWAGCLALGLPASASGLTCLRRRRFLQEQRMACEVGLYYVLHVTKQRNKNALLRLLPGLGECTGGRPPRCGPGLPAAALVQGRAQPGRLRHPLPWSPSVEGSFLLWFIPVGEGGGGVPLVPAAVERAHPRWSRATGAVGRVASC